ncbi:MAG: hypothetical protein JNK53_05465 [Phycisphaerae bacterium]|nr:hypothetical protein [Phycisphaerae bacterium]
MLDYLFQNGAAWFSVPAIVGTLVFLVQMSGLLGDDGGSDGGGADGGGGDGALGDSGDSGGHGNALAGVLSVQGGSAFAMGFGLGGLASLHGSTMGLGLSIAVGVGCGIVFVAVLGMLFRQARQLNSSGNIGIQALVGREADVTSTIPAQGSGRGEIVAVLGDRERRCAATSAGDAIASRSRVVVVRVNGDNSVTVRPVAG